MNMSRRQLIAVGAAIFLLSLSCLLFYFRQNSHLAGNDTIYYMAVADSVIEHGEPLDLTSDPPQRLRTPQNGIVALYVLCKKLGLGTDDTWTFLVLLNFLLHLASLWPLYRIARRAGLGDLRSMPVVALLAFYAGSWQFYRSQLLPVNDAFFNTFSLWLVHFLLELDEGAEGTRRRLLMAATLLFAVALVHFRLQTLLVLGPVLVVFLVLRRLRSAAWTGVLVALALVSLAIPYTLIESSSIESSGQTYLVKAGIAKGGFVQKQIFAAYTWSSRAIPELLFADGGMPMNLLYAPFGLAFLLAVWPAWRDRERDPTSLMLVLICLAGTVFAVVLLKARARYLLYILPFFYLFLLRSPRLRSIGYLFVIASLTISLMRPMIPIQRSYHVDFWLHFIEEGNKKEIDLGERPLLYSQHHRNPYYFLGVAESFEPLTWELLRERDGVFYIGDQDFIRHGGKQVRALAANAGYAVKTRNRTPDYRNQHGYALVEFEIEKRGEP